MKKFYILLFGILTNIAFCYAQESSLKLSGDLMTDQRFLLQEDNPWVWNENRLTPERGIYCDRLEGYSE